MKFKLTFGKNRKTRNAHAVGEEEAVSRQDNVEEEQITVFQKLTSEEANLMEEKQNLASLREKLRLKIRGEIETKKSSIEKLRAEIADLKTVDEEQTVVWQKLTSEEANLMEEKQNVASLREKLRLKTQGEIENKKGSIEKLRAEIANLQASCEEFVESLNAGAKVD